MVVTRPHTKEILIGNVYRSQNGNIGEEIGQISTSMTIIENINKYEILLIGDFNKEYNGKQPLLGAIMIQFAAEHELQQMIQQPTRITRTTNKTIDLALTDIKHCTQARVLSYNISDHKPIFIIKGKKEMTRELPPTWECSYRNYNSKELCHTQRNKRC